MICCLRGLHSLKCCRDKSDGLCLYSERKDTVCASWLYLHSAGSWSELPRCLWPCQRGVTWAAGHTAPSCSLVLKMENASSESRRMRDLNSKDLEIIACPACSYIQHPTSLRETRRQSRKRQSPSRAGELLYSPIGNSSPSADSWKFSEKTVFWEENKTIFAVQ